MDRNKLLIVNSVLMLEDHKNIKYEESIYHLFFEGVIERERECVCLCVCVLVSVKRESTSCLLHGVRGTECVCVCVYRKRSESESGRERG